MSKKTQNHQEKQDNPQLTPEQHLEDQAVDHQQIHPSAALRETQDRPSGTPRPADILALQRAIGNRAVRRSVLAQDERAAKKLPEQEGVSLSSLYRDGNWTMPGGAAPKGSMAVQTKDGLKTEELTPPWARPEVRPTASIKTPSAAPPSIAAPSTPAPSIKTPTAAPPSVTRPTAAPPQERPSLGGVKGGGATSAAPWTRPPVTRPAPGGLKTTPPTAGEPEEAQQAERPGPTPAAETAEAPATGAEPGDRRVVPTFRIPYTVSEIPGPLQSLAPLPVFVLPSLKTSGNLDITRNGSMLASVARVNLGSHRAEIVQSLATEYGSMGYEYTADGLGLTFFDRRFNMEMEIKPGNIVEFKSPETRIQKTIGDWQFQGTLRLTLTLRFVGDPMAVRALMEALAATASMVGLVVMGIELGGQILAGVTAFLARLGTFASGLRMPLVPIITPVVEGVMQEMEQRERQQQGLEPIIS